MTVKYLAGLRFDNRIGLELIIKDVGSDWNYPRHYLSRQFQRIEKKKKGNKTKQKIDNLSIIFTQFHRVSTHKSDPYNLKGSFRDENTKR